jgi:hypothetical protein
MIMRKKKATKALIGVALCFIVILIPILSLAKPTYSLARYVAESFGYKAKTNQKIPAHYLEPVSTSQVQTIGKDFAWVYNNKSYCLHIEVPSKLLEYDRNITETTDKFYNSNAIEQHLQLLCMSDKIKAIVLSCAESTYGNYTPWVNNESNDAYINYLSKCLLQQAQSNGYDNFHTAEFVQSFVECAIPYKVSKKPQLPAQTLVDGGDCKDKSILLASILKNMNYKVALLYFDSLPGQQYGHVAVGIVLNDNDIPHGLGYIPSYYEHNGEKYYFMETTEPNWSLGEISDEKLEQTAYVYPVN